MPVRKASQPDLQPRHHHAIGNINIKHMRSSGLTAVTAYPAGDCQGEAGQASFSKPLALGHYQRTSQCNHRKYTFTRVARQVRVVRQQRILMRKMLRLAHKRLLSMQDHLQLVRQQLHQTLAENEGLETARNNLRQEVLLQAVNHTKQAESG